MIACVVAAFVLSQLAGVPRPVEIVAPEFPIRAVGARINGNARLLVHIASSGEVSSVTTIQSVAPILTGPAESAARKWRFEPSTSPSDRTGILTFTYEVGFKDGKDSDHQPRRTETIYQPPDHVILRGLAWIEPRS